MVVVGVVVVVGGGGGGGECEETDRGREKSGGRVLRWAAARTWVSATMQ